jgi:hypothetical protein
MNRQQAQEILLLYRPGSADAQDPEFAAALALARRDPELDEWLQQQFLMQDALRSTFRQIPIPEGLKEQILSERGIQTSLPLKRKIVLSAVCAVCILLLASLVLPLLRSRDDKSFANFQSRMVKTVARQGLYPKMDLETNDLAEIGKFLVTHQAPANYVLPSGLQKTTGTGCAILEWQGKRVSMVCFNSGKNSSATPSDLFLFVINRADLPKAPPPGAPTFAQTNSLPTASWTHGDKTYILATTGDEASLRKYF